ncbi:MAG TPA: VWA domain-containing protein [Vicinamibacterales bacterium]
MTLSPGVPGGRGGVARRAALLTTAAVCLSLAAAGAQQQQRSSQTQPTFRTDVELVQVDVIVLDEQGRHVRGLKAADFVLEDRGRTQAIAAFEEAAHARPARSAGDAPPPRNAVPLDVSSNQTAAAGRLVVVVVDDLHIWRGRTETAKEIARGILDRLGRDASMAILFTSGDRSTHVTEDRAILLRAVETLRGRKGVRRPTAAVDKQGMAAGGGEGRSLEEIAAAQGVSVQDFFDNMAQYKALEDAARLLGQGDARRKAFVLISEGIAKNPTGIFGSMSETPQAPAGGAEYAATADAAATIVPPATAHHDLALLDMMEAMHRSNVATYAIDPRGEVTSQELALELHPEPVDGDPVFRWHNPLRQAQDGLSTIAEASGGFAIVNTDDFIGGVERILDDLDHYYLLGFYPPDPNRRGYRRLHVSVPGHPEWTVRFRRGYRTGDKKATGKDQSPLVALSAGVLPRTDLGLRVGAVALAIESARETRIALTLEVSAHRATLEDADGRLRDELTYDVLAVDEKRKVVKRAGGLKARATLSRAGGAASPEIATYQIADTIALPPGAYQLRVSAESVRLKKGGSVYLHVDVPDFTREGVTIGGIAIGYANGGRVPEATAAARPSLPFPATLDRAFAATDMLRLYFEVAAHGKGVPLPGRLEVLTSDGATLRSSIDFVADERGRVTLTLPLSNLDAGAYILRATAGPDGPTRDVGVTVR